jgi:hypothetical protein
VGRNEVGTKTDRTKSREFLAEFQSVTQKRNLEEKEKVKYF